MKITKGQTVRPLHDLILVKLHEKVQKKGAIILAPFLKPEGLTEGTVAAVGPGRYQLDGWFKPTTITLGQIVLWGKYSGLEIEKEGEKFMLIEEEKILAVFSEGYYNESTSRDR